MRIVIKIGTSTITHPTGRLNIRQMEALCKVLSDLKNAGNEVILVSSGAIGMGVGKLRLGKRPADVPTKQAAAAVGQCELMYTYDKLFSEYRHTVAQILLTADDIADPVRHENFQNTIQRLLELDAIPIVNENDTVAVTELMFTDNDELSGLLSTMIGAEALVLLTNVDGICDGMPGAPGVEVIREIAPGQRDLPDCIRDAKSSFGRGGMLTKSRIARKVAAEGIETIIADGRRDGILPDLLAEGSRTLCTRFLPSPHPISGVKKWIAHSEGFAKGEVHVTREALDALGGPRAVSLLPVGVSRVEGVFEKDDIVRIVAPDGRPVGAGKVSCDSTTARRNIGRRGARALIHYDYLYLD